MPTSIDIDDAAADLIEAADYLKDRLDAGLPILESQWLGPLMSAHALLMELADAAEKPRDAAPASIRQEQ